jgi:two-component system LytT family sensor kinase
MTRRRPSYVVASPDARAVDHLPLAAALLGIVWNVGAMLVFGARDLGAGYSLAWVAAIANSALGFLPAVVVHASLIRSRRAGYRWMLLVAYGASGVAALMHLEAASAQTAVPSSNALVLLTTTYAVLLTVLAVTERGRPGFQRTLTAVVLAAFAVSALHLSRHAGAPDQDPWAVELIGHHASLPLVLAILYQDYRFAFLDLFLKRALAVLALVGVVVLLYVAFAGPLVDPHAIAERVAADYGQHVFATEVLLATWIATALMYPWIQRRVFRFVDRVVLRRADYHEVRSELADELAVSRDASAALDASCAVLGRALSATSASWSEAATRGHAGHPTIALDARRTQATIEVPTAIEPSYEIVVATAASGRSLLSDDLMLIDAVASAAGRRIDEIRIESERRERAQREQEMSQLATEAELRALRAQLNPHFLFNALNTLGHLMQAAPDRALATLYRLTALLRAVLRRTNGQFVALGDELEIVDAYLAIEHERFQERLTVSIDVPDDLRGVRIPPLVLQPLVENAIKHGIAPKREGGHVSVRARRDAPPGDADGFLRMYVTDSGDDASRRVPDTTASPGVGMANIESRLRHYYGDAAAVSMTRAPSGETVVEVCVPWVAPDRTP